MKRKFKKKQHLSLSFTPNKKTDCSPLFSRIEKLEDELSQSKREHSERVNRMEKRMEQLETDIQAKVSINKTKAYFGYSFANFK